MFRFKIFISITIISVFLIGTSFIKNQTRDIEKKIYSINKKISLKERDYNESQLDFFYLTAFSMKFFRQKYSISCPGSMIAASNFFELAVAVSITLFGVNSGAALATIVGVLVEVPLMLYLVNISKSSKILFIK